MVQSVGEGILHRHCIQIPLCPNINHIFGLPHPPQSTYWIFTITVTDCGVTRHFVFNLKPKLFVNFQGHSSLLCEEDCMRLVSSCVEWSRAPPHLTAAGLCARMTPRNANAPCVQLRQFMTPSKYNGKGQVTRRAAEGAGRLGLGLATFRSKNRL